MTGHATAEGTRRYAARFPESAAHFRDTMGLRVSSIGIGTYLGNPEIETDNAYEQAVFDVVRAGCNLIDTAANYRFQRSERSVGRALRRLTDAGFSRDEIVVCTKAGYIPFDGDVPADPRAYFTETFMRPGIAGPQDIAAGMHCMTPAFLEHQMKTSLRNLGVETVDLFYLHNPEVQLNNLPPEEFDPRFCVAIEFLERVASQGRIRGYGISSWEAFRVPPQSKSHLNIRRLATYATGVAGGGGRSGFRAIQLPYNLLMPEALMNRTQEVDGRLVPALEAALQMGITVFASVPLAQGRLTKGLPPDFRSRFPNLATDALRAIHFVRSTPGITAALVGMSRADHVAENMTLARVPPLAPAEFAGLFQ